MKKFGCEGDGYYIQGVLNTTLKNGDLRIDHIDKTSSLISLKSSYSKDLIRTLNDLSVFLMGFEDSNFADYVKQQFFRDNFVIRVTNKDSPFKTNGQSGFASTARGGCKDIVRNIDFSLSPKSKITGDVFFDVDFKIDLDYSPRISREGTDISYKNPVVSKQVALNKSNGFKGFVRVEYPCVTFATRYTYVYVTDFLLKNYKFSIDIKRIGS